MNDRNTATATAQPRPARGAQNDHVRKCLLDALDAFHALEERGFTVLKVSIEFRAPVIWIQNCALVATLQGAETIIRRGANGRESIFAAPFHGCQVQWRMTEH